MVQSMIDPVLPWRLIFGLPGRISIEAFRGSLQRAGVRIPLEDVGRLSDYTDFYGDGKLAIQAILEELYDGHHYESRDGSNNSSV